MRGGTGRFFRRSPGEKIPEPPFDATEHRGTGLWMVVNGGPPSIPVQKILVDVTKSVCIISVGLTRTTSMMCLSDFLSPAELAALCYAIAEIIRAWRQK
jgi:hypothetical protein